MSREIKRRLDERGAMLEHGARIWRVGLEEEFPLGFLVVKG